MQRDRALILTALLDGLRADELLRANVGDLRRTDDGAVIHVRGKGGKDRRIPIEPALVTCSSAISTAGPPASPPRPNGAPPPAGDWPPGRRRRRCSWVRMATGSRAAPCNTGCCALFAAPASTPTAPAAHSSTGCHTFATELANAEVSVYTLMKLLGHESMVTSQRYVTAAGTETRTAAAQNKLYDLLAEER